MIDYNWDPTRPALVVDDFRLQAEITRFADKHASVSEYAQATGLDTDDVVRLLEPYLDTGAVGLEFYGGEVFVHTAPKGRPAPAGLASAAPNLWERLRRTNNLERAYAYWQLVRSLERAGWHVKTDSHDVLSGLGQVTEPATIGITVGPRIAPLLAYPATGRLSAPNGLLYEYDKAGATVIAVTCDEGRLEETSSAVRRWILSHHFAPRLSVLILEAPRYQPVLHSADDGSVKPISIARAETIQ
jgi:hypothetical protein